jgi:hypothetical protein
MNISPEEREQVAEDRRIFCTCGAGCARSGISIITYRAGSRRASDWAEGGQRWTKK